MMDSFKEGARHLTRRESQAAIAPMTAGNWRDRATRFEMKILEPFAQPPAAHESAASGLDGLLQERYQLGLHDGRQAADRANEQRQQAEWQRVGKTLTERVSALAQNIDQQFRQQEQALADSILDLALDIAHKVLAQRIAIQRDVVLPIVRECLSTLPTPAPATRLYLHPADIELVRKALAVELTEAGVELVADQALEAGGCRLSNDQFTVDASLAVRWQRTLAAIGIEATGFDSPLAKFEPQSDD